MGGVSHAGTATESYIAATMWPWPKLCRLWWATVEVRGATAAYNVGHKLQHYEHYIAYVALHLLVAFSWWKVEKWKIAICTRVILCYWIISTCQENYPASFPFYYWLKYLVVLIMHSILCELFVFPTIASLPSHFLQKMRIPPHRFLPAAITK